MDLSQAKTSFRSPDEFVEYMGDVVPMLEAGLKRAIQERNHRMIAETSKLLAPHRNNGAGLRAFYAKHAKPDGSLEFSMSADAAALLSSL